MRCKRCEGLMVTEMIYSKNGEVSMNRCLHCGECIDTVVISNRNSSPSLVKKTSIGKERLASASLWWESVRSKKCLVSS